MALSFSKDTYTLNGNILYAYFVGLCHKCNKPATPIKRCSGCLLAVYCSKECQNLHRPKHKYLCKEFPVVNGKNALYTKGSWDEHLEGLRLRASKLPYPEESKLLFYSPRVCRICQEATHLSDCQCASVSYCEKHCVNGDEHHKKMCRILGHMSQVHTDSLTMPDKILRDKYLAYLETLKGIFKLLDNIKFGNQNRLLKDFSTMNIHILSSFPLFHSDPWNFLAFELELLQLHVAFVMQGSDSKLNFKMNYMSAIPNKFISYSIHTMMYHEFFSSPQFVEPDVLVIFGNKQEMLENDDEYTHHSLKSYGSMTDNDNTLLILTDSTEDLVMDGIKSINGDQANGHFDPIQTDELGTVNSLGIVNEHESGSLNEIRYFACLKKSFSANSKNKKLKKKKKSSK